MIKKTISYEDLDGNTQTSDFWFQITKAEFLEKAMVEGGEAYLEKLQRLATLTPEDMQNGGGKEVMTIFKMLLSEGVGRRDGDLFIKNEAITNRFMFSGAYDAFFLELISTPDAGAIFMRNMLPRDAHKAIDEALAEKAKQGGDIPELQAAPPVLEEPAPELPEVTKFYSELGDKEKPAWLKDLREPTDKELIAMPKEEMQLAFRLKSDGKLNRMSKPA